MAQLKLDAVLGSLLKNKRFAANLRRVMVLTMWKQVVGPLIAQKSWPVRISEGTLHVGVSSHAWCDQLHLLTPQILERYKTLLGRASVKKIEFRVGRRSKAGGEDPHSLHPLNPPHGEKLPSPPPETDPLAHITNPEVRASLAPGFARLRATRAWKEAHGWTRCATCGKVHHLSAGCPWCEGIG